MAAKYSVEMNRTSDTTLAVGGILQDAVTQLRAWLYEIDFGSEATPVNNALLWVVDRGTTALGTSTGVTPQPLDSADAASIVDAGENFTVNPTIGVRLLSIPLNQQLTYRWRAGQGEELILPATANSSLLVRTPTAPLVGVAVTATVLFRI